MSKKIFALLAGVAILAFVGNAYASVTTDLSAAADAYTVQKDGLGYNTGELWSGKTQSGANKSVYSFLTFDLSGITQIESMYLWLYKTSAVGGQNISVSLANDSSWTESGINWSNKPTYGTALTSTLTSAAGLYQWDISSIAQSVEGGVFSIALTGDSSSAYSIFASRAGVSGQTPFLKVTAAPEPVSSALFLIGGTVMAVRQYRKRRKA